MKIISIDPGSKKIWTAFWDLNMQIAFSWNTYNNINQIIEYISNENPAIVLIWHAMVNEWMDSAQEDFCIDFYNKLKNKFKEIEFSLVDERMTSKVAQQKMRELDIKQKNGKTHEDSLAAQVLLENYFQTL